MADSNFRPVGFFDHPLDPPRLEGVLATLSLKIMLAFIPAILLMLGLFLLHDFVWVKKWRAAKGQQRCGTGDKKMIGVISNVVNPIMNHPNTINGCFSSRLCFEGKGV